GGLGLALAASLAGTAAASGGSASSTIPCSRIEALGIDRQLNLRAQETMVRCGLASAPRTTSRTAPSGAVKASPSLGPNLDVITGTETYPHVTQATASMAIHGSTVVVVYDDSRAVATSPIILADVSVSTNGGTTYTRAATSPFTG